MTSYFPIPKNYKCISQGNITVKSSLTIFNYPNNCLMRNSQINKKDIFFYIYYLTKKKWKQYEKIICEYGEKVEIKRDDLDIPNNSLAVVIPSYKEDNPKDLSILIKPSSIRKDKTPVAERASYNFSINNLTTSFQGEYPFDLANLKKTSFFSFDSLRNDSLDKTETYLILINLDREAANCDIHKVFLYLAKSKKVIKKVNIKTNSCNYVKLPKIKGNHKSAGEPIFISCATKSFIPLYLTINFEKDNFEIAVEHTHPPSELFWGDNKYQYSKLLKSNWIK
tara:strand:+ start:46836 stop:47678 length:843 start_codon:yes stop_codon:yes gene_type:complete